jgi:UDP-glucuronate 4-epimerase
MSVLITGCYGFLGHATACRLLKDGHQVYGIDKVRDAISPKAARIANLSTFEQFKFHEINLSNFDALLAFFDQHKIDSIVHYAGQYSVPLNRGTGQQFIEANLVGYTNLMEAARINKVHRVVYASSTFVQDGRLPNSMYGATKEFGERCGNVYSHTCGMGFVALRFGSTYGPDCRPDIGAYQLIKKLFNRVPIDTTVGGFNYKVAFLFSEDAVEVVVRCLTQKLDLPYNVQTVVADDFLMDLNDLLTAMEKASGLKAIRSGELEPRQGFVTPTDKCDRLRAMIGYAPQTKLDEGMEKFVAWYKTNNPS